MPVQSEPTSTTCPHCGTEVAADQRYCLACGRPCSPVRLAFLDVLQGESAQHTPSTTVLPAASGYLPPLAPEPRGERLARHTGLFALLATLLLTGAIGLLIGHWIGGSGGAKTPSVIKVEGFGAVGAPASSTSGGSTGEEVTQEGGEGGNGSSGAAGGKGAASKSETPKVEAKEQLAKEEREVEEPAKLPSAVKTSKATDERLSKLSGKQYEQEINKIVKGPEPIETG
ncbi:MAG TPA: zinc ribbon domain-containing protein [Solirubrobacteraceae bacterium]